VNRILDQLTPLSPNKTCVLGQTLLTGLEDPAAKSACAAALRRYGSRASFAVDPLLELARTNDPPVSSVAKWTLSGIDPEAAARAVIR
jgi:hypothetical protein